MSMRSIGYALALVLFGGLACHQDVQTSATPVEVGPPEPRAALEPEPTSGLRLVVVDAPAHTTLTVHASDTRPPLVPARPLRADERLELSPGFLTVVLRSEDDVRTLQFYCSSVPSTPSAGAELHYRWDEPDASQAHGLRWLDRAKAEQEAQDFRDALMAEMSSAEADEDRGAALEATLAAQRQEIEALGHDEHAHLRRLFHATNAVQITGPDDAWSVIEPIPADSIAWAAYSNHLLELRALFGDHARAAERFEQVRARVADVGLTTAFRAGDLLVADRSGDESALASAYVAASMVAGPPQVGQPMPRFELVDVQTRQPLRSEDLAGTPYLLELWSTWCEPCIAQMGALHELHAELGSGDAPRLQIVSIAVNDARTPVTAFRSERWPMPWANVWAPNGEPIFSGWSISSVPYAVLVDAEGTVRRAGPHVELAEVRAAAR